MEKSHVSLRHIALFLKKDVQGDIDKLIEHIDYPK